MNMKSSIEPPFDVKAFLSQLTTAPGVYQMYDAKSQLIYVGKARNLRARVSSYFQKNPLPKTALLISHLHHIEVIITQSENEALILESNLIKQHRPRFNVLLRDDKSFPYIYLSSDQTYPAVTFYRGTKKAKGDYFGPYPSSGAVRETLRLLQKLFRLRQCDDSFFRNRSRPCLQYQIGRCTAPCVGLITPASYAEDVVMTKLFLQGKDKQLLKSLGQRMSQAAAAQNYELAAKLRDMIQAVQQVQEQQYADKARHNVDCLAILRIQSVVCISVLFIRGGRVMGNKPFFPKAPLELTVAEILTSFIGHYYLQSSQTLPSEIICNIELDDASWLAEAIAEKRQARVRLLTSVRGTRARWQAMTVTNAENQLQSHLASQRGIGKRLKAMAQLLGLSQPLARIECFDISHSQGEATVASCVVCGPAGMDKTEYRRFNISGITPGDDYAATRQAISRHYRRRLDEKLPLADILLIDGGQGQVSQAQAVLNELAISDVLILGVAKGPSRKPGMELLMLANHQGLIQVNPDNPGLHLIQHIRDEAHRFAITGHRQARAKKRKQSSLENISGIGAKKRQALLTHFGGLQQIKGASVEALAAVEGVSTALAQRIYDSLH